MITYKYFILVVSIIITVIKKCKTLVKMYTIYNIDNKQR